MILRNSIQCRERRRLAGERTDLSLRDTLAGRLRSQGSVLIIVLWVCLGLVGIALYFANSMTYELRASDNRVSGLVSDQAIEGAARYVGYMLQNFATNGTSKVLSGDFKVGNVTSLGVPEPVAVEMFTATGALSVNAPWGDIQRVTYELKQPTDRSAAGKDLVRSVVRNLLTMTTPDVENQLMLSGVASIKFTCFDGAQWQDTWDTTSMTSVNTNLPLAVRVDIQMAGNSAANAQPIEIVVPIDSQSRTNAVITVTP